jgi:hypothetical protein
MNDDISHKLARSIEGAPPGTIVSLCMFGSCILKASCLSNIVDTTTIVAALLSLIRWSKWLRCLRRPLR